MAPLEMIEKTRDCPHVDRGDLFYACKHCGLCGSWPREGETLDTWELRRISEVQERLKREVAELRANHELAELRSS